MRSSPKLQPNLVMRKHQTAPGWGTFCRTPDQYCSKWQGLKTKARRCEAVGQLVTAYEVGSVLNWFLEPEKGISGETGDPNESAAQVEIYCTLLVSPWGQFSSVMGDVNKGSWEKSGWAPSVLPSCLLLLHNKKFT